jgi:hypothetical protein
MRKEWISALLAILIASIIIILPTMGASGSGQISSYGTIEYPSETNNLIVPFGQAVFGVDWAGYTGFLGNYAFLDSTTYHGQVPSMKILPDPNNITPGDPSLWSARWDLNSSVTTVIVGGWVKVSSGQEARIACDFRDSQGVILNNYGQGPPYTGNWTATATGDSWVYLSLTYYNIQSTTAVNVLVWIQNFPPVADGGNVTGACWFDNIFLYITYG